MNVCHFGNVQSEIDNLKNKNDKIGNFDSLWGRR